MFFVICYPSLDLTVSLPAPARFHYRFARPLWQPTTLDSRAEAEEIFPSKGFTSCADYRSRNLPSPSLGVTSGQCNFLGADAIEYGNYDCDHVDANARKLCYCGGDSTPASYELPASPPPPAVADTNGCGSSNTVGQISMKVGRAATFVFEIRRTSDNELVSLPGFDFVLLDMDGTSVSAGDNNNNGLSSDTREVVSVSGYHTYSRDPSTTVFAAPATGTPSPVFISTWDGSAPDGFDSTNGHANGSIEPTPCTSRLAPRVRYTWTTLRRHRTRNY